MEVCMRKYGFRDWDSVLAAIGHGALKEGQVINRLQEEYRQKVKKEITDEKLLESVGNNKDVKQDSHKAKAGIIVQGLSGVAVHLSKCCSPVPGDEIVGFVTRGRGVSVHRTDCINIINASEDDRHRMIAAEWNFPEGEKTSEYYAEIRIYANNRSGVLLDISKIFSSASSKAAIESVEGTSGSKGWQFCDTLLILCAVAFTFHILVIDKCVQFVDAMRVATVQSLVAGVIALIVSIVLGESWSLEHVLGAAYSILYCAACSTGIGYSCQFLGQRSVHPVAASLIMSLESVFAAIGGYLLLGERMETMELWGCAIIFVAVILAQIPTKSKS
jgi:uncharacterized membrane protein